MKRKIIWILLCLLLLTGCGSRKNAKCNLALEKEYGSKFETVIEIAKACVFGIYD